MAQEAARIMFDEAVLDYGTAKRKARQRLGLPGNMALPTNADIEAELVALQRLFGGAEHDARVLGMRQTALEAMRLLENFSPRLVGPVLAGTATRHSPVNLHLFADSPEEVVMLLMQQRIPFENFERRLRPRSGSEYAMYPAIRFVAGDVAVEATIFPSHGVRQAPLSPVDGRPMRRASRKELEALLRAG